MWVVTDVREDAILDREDCAQLRQECSYNLSLLRNLWCVVLFLVVGSLAGCISAQQKANDELATQWIRRCCKRMNCISAGLK